MRVPGFLFRILALFIACLAIGLIFVQIVRPAYLDWGSTAAERTRPLPGDGIVAGASSQQTRAITINAPADRVWPWLAQLGQDRGGFYSFDLLENLAGCEMPTVDVLRPDKQIWQVGDKLWMYPSHKAGGIGFATLRVLEPGRALGFGARMMGASLEEPEIGSWTLVIEPIGTAETRLLARGRGIQRHSLLGVAFDQASFEPAHFVMERRMMIGLKQLAETGKRGRVSNHVHVGLWMLTFVMFLTAAAFVLIGRRWLRSLGAFVAAAAVFQILTLMQPPLVVGVLLVLAVFLLLRGHGDARLAAPETVSGQSPGGTHHEPDAMGSIS
jgi:hypothetical protein